MTETQWEHDMAAPDYPESFGVVDDGPPASEGEPFARYDGEGGPWADVDPGFRTEVESLTDDSANVSIDFHEANRILNRYRRAYREIGTIDAELSERIDELNAEAKRLQERAAEMRKPAERRIAFLDAFAKPALMEYAAKETEGKKTRTVKLLDGSLRFRKQPDRLEVTDETTAITYAKHYNADLLNISLNKTAAKKAIKDTGEVIPGTSLIIGEDAFAIEVE